MSAVHKNRGLVPLFALYGEPVALSEGLLDPIHVENLFLRSHANHWTIRPHRHAELHQIFWIRQGEGVIHLEGGRQPFTGPCLFILPPGVVHGFEYEPGCQGHVLSMMRGFVTAQESLLAERGWLHRHGVVPVPGAAAVAALDGAFEELSEAFTTRRQGRRAALTGRVLLAWSLMEELAGPAQAQASVPAPQAALVERFRAVVEEEFRAHAGLEALARRLGTSPGRLTRACRMVAGQSPLEMVHERLMLEARRLLTYTAMNVSEVAYALGFSDTAYFSRFFSRRAGNPPLAFQRDATRHGPRKSEEK